MTKLKNEKIIESIMYAGHQSISRREIYILGNFKIKLELKSDSYECQSYARAYALDGVEWKLIYSIPYSKMKTGTKLIYATPYRNGNENKAKSEFDADVQILKDYVKEILG